MTSSRIVSSSRPIASMSAGGRGAGAGMGGSLDVERAVARGRGDAGLDEVARLAVDVAGADVADLAGQQGDDAAVADAHPAAARHQDTGVLAGLEQGLVGEGAGATSHEGDGALAA